MRTIDTLLSSTWIIPIEPSNTLLEEHAIAIDKGKIVAVLPIAQAQTQFQAQTQLHLNDHVLMPGLINAHTHSPMALLRGIADDLKLMDWLEEHIWPAERQVMGDKFAYEGTQLAIMEMLRSGTTCFNDMYFFSHSIAQAAADANMRAVISSCLINFSSAYAETPEEYLHKVTDLEQKWRGHDLICITAGPHAPYTVNDELFVKIKEMAEKYNLRIHLHLQETAHEVEQSLKEYNKRPVKRLYDLGFLSERLQCIHMTQINDEDIVYLQRSKAHVIHCPQSNLKLASGFCPVKKLMDHDINVALGTDGAASNNNLDMFEEMRTASLLAKAVAQDPTALNAFAALEMATINGARALGLNDKIGSLIPGKSADIISIDLSDIHTQPVYNPASLLVYAVNSQQVKDVWIEGKRLLAQGKLTEMDEQKILANTKRWQQELKQHEYKASGGQE